MPLDAQNVHQAAVLGGSLSASEACEGSMQGPGRTRDGLTLVSAAVIGPVPTANLRAAGRQVKVSPCDFRATALVRPGNGSGHCVVRLLSISGGGSGN
jgi:hypothetical protein